MAYVTPTPIVREAPITASTQVMESRPTFRGQVDGVRLGVFAGVAVVPAVALFFLEYHPLVCVLVWFVAFAGFYVADLLTVTGYFHKALEQRTERLRIEAALAQNQTGDEGQQAQIDLLLDAVADLQERIAKLETVRIVDRGVERDIEYGDDLDTELRRWIQGSVFSGGTLAGGVYPNGQLRGAMPYKEGSDGYRRLLAAGLVVKKAGNYFWTGPALLIEALGKLVR